MVKRARKEEMKMFGEMGVYIYIKREEAEKDEDGTLIGVRWVDVAKNDLVRSRLVAQEFKIKGDRDDLFAGTPPLSAVKFLISNLCSNGKDGIQDKRFMILDVKRAFLYGNIEEPIYITLPDEDPKSKQGYVGRLVKAMYGTQSAPLIWQKLCKRVMESNGFESCITSPCCYFHPKRDIRVVTHVDDFACTGGLEDLVV